jgi:hypothetical protein
VYHIIPWVRGRLVLSGGCRWLYCGRGVIERRADRARTYVVAIAAAATTAATAPFHKSRASSLPVFGPTWSRPRSNVSGDGGGFERWISIARATWSALAKTRAQVKLGAAVEVNSGRSMGLVVVVYTTCVTTTWPRWRLFGLMCIVFDCGWRPRRPA